MAHLTLVNRLEIEFMLKSNLTINQIATSLKKACSTISREINKHAVLSDKVSYHRIPNRCIHRFGCYKTYVCPKHYASCRKKKCYTCRECNALCPDFIEDYCLKLNAPPYVCNGCGDEHRCSLFKRFYVAKIAHENYRNTLVAAREGVNLTELEHQYLDELFSPFLINGQSIHHIWASHKSEMIRSEKSIYRYVNSNLFSARNIDLPRVLRRKPRKTTPVQFKVDKLCHQNRTYSDFKRYLADNPDIQVIEMDTVEGKKGGKVLLTLHFKGLCDFMLAFLRDRNTAQSVSDVFNQLYDTLGPIYFRKLCHCFLTDRGSEFSNPAALEKAPDQTQRCKIFYCDPQAAWQKPNVELNHEFIRRILPKGVSFDCLTQQHVNLMMNHINSYRREKLNDRSPTEALSSLFGHEVLDLLNVELIPPNEIILHPKLLAQIAK